MKTKMHITLGLFLASVLVLAGCTSMPRVVHVTIKSSTFGPASPEHLAQLTALAAECSAAEAGIIFAPTAK